MSSKRTLMFVMTLMVLIIGISAVSAADVSVNDTTTVSADTPSVTTEVTAPQKIAEDTQIEAKDVITPKTVKKESKAETKTVKSEKTANTIKSNSTKAVKRATTHVVNQDNWQDTFTLTNSSSANNYIYSLNDNVAENDVIDFQGRLTVNATLHFNKTVTVTSTTKDTNVTLNTTAGSLLGEAPGHSFWIDRGAAYSTFSNINLYNTQFWVQNTHDVNFTNMSMVVNNARVGSGVGQTAIRNSTFIRLDNSFIYTKDNGGSSSFVITYGDYCTINNCTIQGEGTVGNIIYINTFNAPAGATGTNSFNNITNNTIIGPAKASSICWALTVNGHNNTLSGNKMYYVGNGITAGWGTRTPITNFTVTNNEFHMGCGINVALINSTYANNTVYDNGVFSFGTGCVVENNTAGRVTLTQNGATFAHNNITGTMTINQATNVYNNTINSIVINNAAAEGTNITDNNITGTISITRANGITITNNNITNNADYTINTATSGNVITNNYLLTATHAGDDTVVSTGNNTITNNRPVSGGKLNITDATYSNFFDENGVFNNDLAGNYSELTFIGEFNNKNFTFANIITNLISDNATFNDATITITNNTKLVASNFKINNKNNNNNAIILNSTGNSIRNFEINHETTNTVAQEILVNGDENTIENSHITIQAPSTGIDYTKTPAIANVAAIIVSSSSNTITNNNINMTSTVNGLYGTTDAITIQSATKADSNQITRNTITMNGKDYVYAINLGDNANSNNVQSNTITMTSDNYAAGIQLAYGNITNNQIQSNTITINSTSDAYGIELSVYGDANVTGNQINSNTINAEANNVYLIEVYGSGMTTPINATTINSNKLTGNGNYTTGIIAEGENFTVNLNTITLNGVKNDTTSSSMDLVLPETVGIKFLNVTGVAAARNIVTVPNGPAYKLVNTKEAVMTTNREALNSDNDVIVLINSDNNNLTGLVATTQGDYVVRLTNSSNNNILRNTLNVTSNLRGGDSAVTYDVLSTGNVIANNTPVLFVVTNETYSTLFDENGNFRTNGSVNTLTLGSDLYGVNINIDRPLTFLNAANYTMYNGTVNITGNFSTGREVYIDGINFNNINKTAVFVGTNKTSQINIYVRNGNITIAGDNIVALSCQNETNKAYHYFRVENVNITMTGENITAVKASGQQRVIGRYTWNTNPLGYVYLLNSNVIMNATGSSTVLDANHIMAYVNHDNITQTGNLVKTVSGNDTVFSGTEGFRYNNINVTGDNVYVLNASHINSTNIDSASIYYNNITVTSSNPVIVMNLVGPKYYVEHNNIVVNAYTNGTPLITAENYSNNRVRNNYIVALDECGNDAVNHTGISVTGNTPIKQLTVTLNKSDYVVAVGDEIIFNGTIVDAYGHNISGVTVTVTIEGSTFNADVENGVYTYTYVPTEAKEGIDVLVTVSGNGYTTTTASTIFDAEQLDAVLANVTIDNVVLDHETTATGRLVEMYSNKPIANATVILTTNGRDYPTTTDDNGIFNITFDAPVTTGEYAATVNYDGDARYVATSRDTSYDVERHTSMLSLYSINDAKYGDIVRITGMLTDENDAPVSGTVCTITLIVNGIEYNTTVDSTGSYSLRVPAVLGVNNVTASFNGNERYEATNSISRTFNGIAHNVTITIDQVADTKYDDTVAVTGKLVDVDTPVSNAIIIVTINGKQYITATNNNGVYTINNVPAVFGSNNITASFNGDERYNQASTDATFNGIARDTTVTVNPVRNALFDNQVTVTGLLHDDHNIVISGVTVNVAVNGKDYPATTDANGVYTVSVPAALGVNNVVVSYNGNNTYNKASDATTTFNGVAHDSSLTVDSVSDVIYDSTTTVTGKLVDANSTAVANADIIVTVNGKDYPATTDANGVYTVSVPAAFGANSVIVSFNGNDAYNKASNVTTTFNGVAHDSSLTVDSVSDVIYDSTTTVTGKLVDANSTAVANADIIVTVNGKDYPATTDANGVYTVSVPAALGANSVIVSFNGNDAYNKASDATTTFNGVAHDSSLTVDSVSDVIYDSTTTVTGKLADANSTAVANADIIVTVNGNSYTTTTDANGVYTVSVPAALGANNAVVSFNGNNAYKATNARTTFNGLAHNTTLTVESVDNTKINKTVTVTGKLVDVNSTAVANANITVTVNDVNYTATTDANGTYAVDNVLVTSTDNTVVVSYNGNNTYNKASDVNTTFIGIKLDTITTIEPINGVLNKTVSFIAHVVDENNNTVTGGSVVFKVNGVTLKDANGTAIHVNVINGTAVLDTIATWINPRNISVSYTGNEIYSESRMDNGTISIAKQNATIGLEILSENLKPGDELVAVVRVTDENNNPVTGGTVIFKLNGKTLKDANGTKIQYNVTNGVVTLNYAIPENYSAKNYTLTAVYSGSIYNRADDTQNFTLSNLDAVLGLNVISQDLKPTHELVAVANVTDVNGNPVNRGKVIFKLNGKTLKDENGTNIVVNVVNGTARLNYVLSTAYSAKTYNLTAVFSGSNYNTQRTSQNITVTKLDSYIQPENVTISGNTLHVGATIRNNETKAIASEKSNKVSIKLDQHTVINQATVNNGLIDLNATLDGIRTGVHTVQIIAGGNSIYNLSRVNVEVQK